MHYFSVSEEIGYSKGAVSKGKFRFEFPYFSAKGIFEFLKNPKEESSKVLKKWWRLFEGAFHGGGDLCRIPEGDFSVIISVKY